jgi:small nuclear ribonucleoprotein (snRNP)-like protein
MADLSVTGQAAPPFSLSHSFEENEGGKKPATPASALKMLGRSARVAISDGRVFYGELVGFDGAHSVLLRAADEYAAHKEKSEKESFPCRGSPSIPTSYPGDDALVFRRNVDDVMVPGEHLVSIALLEEDEETGEGEEEEGEENEGEARGDEDKA